MRVQCGYNVGIVRVQCGFGEGIVWFAYGHNKICIESV